MSLSNDKENLFTNYGSTGNTHDAIEAAEDEENKGNSKFYVDDNYTNEGFNNIDGANDEDDDDDDESYLLGEGKNSNKFLGYRKSILNKLPFRFPRSRRQTNQRLTAIGPNRSHSVNANSMSEGKNESTASKMKCTPFYRVFSAINERLFPSSFILNTDDESVSPLNRLKKGFKTFVSLLPHIKTTILVLYSLMCVVLFMLYNDKEENWYQSVISSNSTYSFSYKMLKDSREDLTITKSQYLQCILHGPFKNEKKTGLEKSLKINTISYIRVDVYEENKNSNNTNSKVPLSSWTMNILDSLSKNTYSELSYAENIFKMDKKYELFDVIFVFTTTSVQPLSINFDCKQLSQHTENKTVYATLLLIFVYALIMFDLVHRTLAAGLGAIGGLAVISVIEMNRPPLNTIASWVEWETLLLMFGMMVIVAIFCETGLFDLIAVQIFRYVGNRLWVMIASMCLLAAVLSAFLDNVTTILLLSPITIKLSEVLSLDPRHLLIAQVIFSNIGGTSTAIGDPPNVIITANSVIRDNDVDFAKFTLHMLVGSVLVYIVAFIHFRILYSDAAGLMSEDHSDVSELHKEILIWKRTFKNITPMTKEEIIVKTLLKEKVSQLQNVLSKKIYQIKQEKETSFRDKTNDLIQNYKINSVSLLIKCSILFMSTLLLFFVHPFITGIHLTIGWIAILSAMVLLALTATSTSHSETSSSSVIDLEAVIHKVEWSTLLFFACLFIFMRTIEELGLLHDIGELVSNLIKSVHGVNDRIAISLVIILIVSALVSSVIDNIPFTTAMIPIIIQLNETLDIPLQPLAYALAFGSCLGGNGTLVGASCNLVAAGISEQHGYRISFIRFFKLGFPIMLSSVAAALIYMCITTSYLKWY